MGHKNKKSLVRQVQENLQEKLHRGIGTSRHEAKQSHTTADKIFSYNTFKTYMKANVGFVNFCKENYGCKTLDECRPHVDDFIQHRIDSGVSSFTLKMESSAIGKLFNEPTTAFCPTPSRTRSAVVRSRGAKAMDRHFSETKNSKLVEFCRSTGLRRMEVAAACGSHLVACETPKGEQFHGVGILVPNGKGGKSRVAPLCCSKETAERIIQQCKEAGDGKLFDKVHAAADVHGYRAQYASSFYTAIARDVSTLRGQQRYVCRGDKAGVVYDRSALRQTSIALGHNRVEVVANSYLHDLK